MTAERTLEKSTAAQKRPGLREAQRQFARQHILDAAVEVFVDLGYIASTVEDIIERAGTSRGTFYTHFRSKSHVIAELATRLLPEIEDSYRRLDVALADGSKPALHGWFLSVIDYCDRYGRLLPALEQAGATEPKQRARRRKGIRRFADWMPRYLERWPKRDVEEARMRIILLSVQLDRFFLDWAPRTLEAAALALVADVLTNIWYDALQAPPALDLTSRPTAESAEFEPTSS